MSSILGLKFGKLIVISESDPYIKPSDGKKEKRFLCLCECGGTTITSKRKLEAGHTKSCGCLLTKHGLSKHDDYNVWNMVIQRCTNKNFPGYEKYGLIGIDVCPEWLSFERFLSDMGERPSKNHTIERIDVTKGYSKDNCIWTDDASLQMYNQHVKSSNKSGTTGVHFDNHKQKWIATIRKKDLLIKKEFFDIDSAILFRKSLEIELYGFNKCNDKAIKRKNDD